MLTKNEITALGLSPTKKDFVQIWNELLEVASKLSERWDPTSTNESDPGIVILKALTGIADKLNYNIDKNTLEAFMPTAAQEDSMRKLCDMLGYSMKYYRSAETQVTIKYHNSDPSEEEAEAMSGTLASGPLAIPKFTVITNSDKDISYFTTNQTEYFITTTTPSVTLNCMEGQIVKCESTADNNVITAAQISENNRFYLPEAQIAENGIFVYNVVSGNSILTGDGTPWEKVDNLNIQARGTRVFKFGYDSYMSRPYIELPEDYSELIQDGLSIYYARTSGADGNISPRTLTQLEIPSGEGWSAVSAESFSVENTFAATTGANLETISQAYNNFKKTIGTFETLVTCRDYMNKIYAMIDDLGKPVVSNVLVTDIRNDLNRAITICSCDDAGIFYKETPLTTVITRSLKQKNSETTVEVEDEVDMINHFDLVLYPFKSYSQIRSNVKNIQEAYDSSFKYSSDDFAAVQQRINSLKLKTISHNIVAPRENDIISINNYLRLNAIIGTNYKLTNEEGILLKETIKIAVANAFNMRELDFGEEIPFESIVEVIEKADPRIKLVSLNEPALYTTFSVLEKSADATNKLVVKEYAVASDNWLTEAEADATGRFEIEKDANGTYAGTYDTKKAKELYNKLVVRNILAGRVPLFKYNNTFTSNFSEGAYQISEIIDKADKPDLLAEPSVINPSTIWTDGDTVYTGRYISTDLETGDINAEYKKISTPEEYLNNIITKNAADDNNITEIETACKIFADTTDDGQQISDVTLSTGEQIKFRAPNFITQKTYPAYVNYHLALNRELRGEAQNAEATSLFTQLDGAWDSIFDEESIFSTNGSIKKFTLTQVVRVNPTDALPQIGLEIDNAELVGTNETPASILKRSGCIKVLNNGEPTFKWITEAGGPVIDDITPFKITNSEGEPINYITNPEAFNTIQEKANATIESLSGQLKDWAISYEFAYIPFDVSTLTCWEKFVEKFNIVKDAGTILWRIYSGSTYAKGKYVLAEGTKLLPFTSAYFGTLDSLQSYLHGIYIASSLGRDTLVNYINNNEEYELKDGEHLYIEYTPSTTADDGTTTQAQEPVKEIHGPGTIIRPNGFESDGLKDSSGLALSVTPVKTTTFKGVSGEIPLFSLGANEQVEIRDRARVVLNKNDFADSKIIYVYKNFNNCPELERIPLDDTGFSGGERINSSYTLKDGEYIFYTDQNQAEFAYYGAGTEITLTGNTVIPEFDVIELSTIFDSGIQEIPWQPIRFSSEDDGIVFQEYQYITLGAGDTLKKLKIKSPLHEDPDQAGRFYLDGQWQVCEADAKTIYHRKGADEDSDLPKISISGTSGWEVCSSLSLNTSPSVGQVLRATDKVVTSAILKKPLANAEDLTKNIVLTAQEGQSPIAFKTNLTCQSSTGKIKLEDIYLNPDNLKSFEFKIFSEKAPSIENVMPNSLAPYYGTLDLSATATVTMSSQNELWNSIPIPSISPVGTQYDRALKLSISTIPDTYGIFSIYIKYPNSDTDYETWIEQLPGANTGNIELFNTTGSWVDKKIIAGTEISINPRLVLKPGLNCIKANTTCSIYIKSDCTEGGVLYFDNLRLVDIIDSKTLEKTTYGFNLDQLGYLNAAAENAPNVFDSRARKNLKKVYAEETLAEVKAKLQELSSEAGSIKNELDADTPKLQKITNYLSNALTELNKLIKTDETDDSFKAIDTIRSLIAQYNTLESTLETEKALQEALFNSSDIEEITQRLAELYGDLDELALVRQDVVNALKSAREAALAKADAFDSLDADIIKDDFQTATSSMSSTDMLLHELKSASLVNINKSYSKQIDTIISTIVDADSAYANVAKQLYATKYSEIISLVKELLDNLDTESIDTQLTSIITSVGTSSPAIDYTNTIINLIDLREDIEKVNISNLLDKIEFSLEDDFYENLKTAIDALKAYLTTGTSQIISDINEIISLLQAKTSNTYDAIIYNKLVALKNSITIKNEDALAKVDSITFIPYDSIINNLKDAANATIQECAAILEGIVATMSAEIADIKSYTTASSYSDAEAISIVWPRYMQSELIKTVDSLYHALYKMVLHLELNPDFSINSYANTARSAISNAANIKLFKKCYQQIRHLVDESNKITERKTVIENLSDLALVVPEGSKLGVALAAFIDAAGDNVGENIVIYSLAMQLKNCTVTDVLEQQQIILELKEELTKAIQLDTNLLKVNADMLSPSILLYKDLTNSTFYDEIKDTIKNNIKVKFTDEITEDDIAECIGLLEGYLSNIDNKQYTGLLPESYITKYNQWTAAAGKIPDKNPTEFELFSIVLNENLKAAWEITPEDDDPYYIDSAGNEIADITNYDYLFKDDVWTTYDTETSQWVNVALTEVYTEELMNIIEDLTEKLYDISKLNIPEAYKERFNIASLETQLLAEIRTADKNGDFYYNVPVETNVAIDFNEGDDRLNTLMNPAVNYDINNVNNSFVISKIDIDYLNKGLQIARSSRIS